MSSERYDLIIRNGEVIDGSGAPRRKADVGVQGDRIANIGDLSQSKAGVEFDAANRVVAPGFIDVHTHDDHALLSKPDMTYKTSQGVTTIVAGNCGVSLAPLRFTGDRPPPPLDLLGDGYKFPRMSDFFDAVAADPAATNAALLCGHTTLRVGAMDDLQRPATDDEISEMRDHLAEALDAGAVGLSTGLAYEPANPAPTSEVLKLAELLGPAGALYTTHLRNEGNDIVESLEEAFHIGRESDAAVVLSHHKLTGKENIGRSEETLELIESIRKEQRVDLDVYPYVAGSTVLQPWRLGEARRVIITWSVPEPEAGGRDLADIAEEWGLTQEEACERLQPAGAIYFMMDESDVQRIIKYPHSMIASDGLPHDHHPHPRLWGTFPRVLGKYSREENLISLEDAVYRMSGKPAEVFGLSGRGEVAVGNFADMVVFNPDTVIDKADFENPMEPAAGIDAVFVNGQAVYRDGASTGARPGKALKRQSSAAY
ncbi:MAG: D-aminoacylase [Pseudomonadota bacterium]|nr:D-aminoacylase [Pseudomonadota bacterium]